MYNIATQNKEFMLQHNTRHNNATHSCKHDTGLILGLRPANERRRYFVTTSLNGWAQT